MEDSLIGAISAGVICGVLFCITIAVVCYLIYRCRRHEDEKSSQHDHLINGHIPNGHISNGHIPTITQLVPMPGSSPSRPVYQFPTMPVRHMASYRPRYIEERNPAGMSKVESHNMAMKSQTYSGPYTQGPVFYDVRQHGGYRSNRSPEWTQKTQEEAVATMNLGEESPKLSVRHFVMEENNNRTSVKSKLDSSKRSSRIEDLRIPSPDASRKEYLFTSELEPLPPPPSQLPNENTRDIHTVLREPANEVRHEVQRESSRRQRRGDNGAIPVGNVPRPFYSKSGRRKADPTPDDFDGAVYIFSGTPQTFLEDSPHQSLHQQPHLHPHIQPEQHPRLHPQQEPVERYFINDDVYTVSSKVTRESPLPDGSMSNSSALHVIGRPVRDPNVEYSSTGSHEMRQMNQPPQGNGLTSRPLSEEIEDLTNSKAKEHHVDYRVIKSKRRPSWLQNAGQWFSKGKKNK